MKVAFLADNILSSWTVISNKMFTETIVIHKLNIQITPLSTQY